MDGGWIIEIISDQTLFFVAYFGWELGFSPDYIITNGNFMVHGFPIFLVFTFCGVDKIRNQIGSYKFRLEHFFFIYSTDNESNFPS